jgi:hypothetical protein
MKEKFLFLSFSVLANIHEREQKIAAVEDRNELVFMYSTLPQEYSLYIRSSWCVYVV